MPFDGNGVFVRNYDWENDRNAGLMINATRMDADTDDIASGLTNCVTKDGQTTPTSNLKMGGFIHTNVGNATALNHYGVVSQIQNSSYVYCGTAGGSANAITIASTPGIATYVAGQRFIFVAASANTSGVTVNVNALGAKNLYKTYNTALAAGDILANQVVEIVYDGIQFQLVAPIGYLSTTTPTFKAYRETIVSAGNINGSVSIDYAAGNHYAANLNGNTTFSFTNPPASGVGMLFVYLTTDNGSRTVTWPSSVKWPNDIVPPLTATAGNQDQFSFITLNGGTRWTGGTRGLNYDI